MSFAKLMRTICVIAGLLIEVGCGGGGGGSNINPTSNEVAGASGFTIGGTLSGLVPGSAQLVITNNETDTLTLTTNGPFTFSSPVTTGAYTVAVKTLPSGENCSIANFHGTSITANVTNLSVTCSENGYRIGGSVSGLNAGQQVVLLNNGGNPVTVSANGVFNFSTLVPYNGSFAITVGTQPTAQFCTVTNATGSGVIANVSSVKVLCSASSYDLGGSVTGLAAGTQLVLQNNGGNSVTVGANGPFTFNTGVAAAGSYSVTVLTQPKDQTCTVINGFGANVLANIVSIKVTCVANNSTYTIGGSLSGLMQGAQVTLLNNGTNAQTVYSNGTFSFSTPVALNGAYSVTIGTQPNGQICTVNNGSGAGVTAGITSIQVICSIKSLTVGGTVSGLNPGSQLVLYNNSSGGLIISANGEFKFATPIAYGSSYLVAVSNGSQPTGQTCSVVNGIGANATSDINSVQVFCSKAAYKIGGSVNGLASGTQITLLNNGTDAITLTSGGVFNFSTLIPYQGSYSVTVGTQPAGQSCTVSQGSGSNISSNISSVAVTCQAGAYTIGGTISGLIAGNQLRLTSGSIMSGAESLIISNNGSFQFATKISGGGSYIVNAGSIPPGQNCTIKRSTTNNSVIHLQKSKMYF